ncbi:sensor histidine kinase [Desulfosoma caldarium]|uniref:histidine kinase n=1 Tax=Desulfosoma caldarium TaxID=610254 RepID=A0A3N1USN3_9BACT|nr:sensor histidine kinase [Desulfosoma caldarium]ROQ90861.1 PAS domain S-box-containing protein [Desulfosoma caldarium]
MLKSSFGTKIFVAIVGVSAATLVITGGFLYWHGTALLRLKSTEELFTASNAIAYYMEHNLEDVLRQLEACPFSWAQQREGARGGSWPDKETAIKESFSEYASQLFRDFPWIAAVALRNEIGKILLCHGEENLLSPSLGPCDPIALLPKGCLLRGPETKSTRRVYVELGLSRIREAHPRSLAWTFVVDVSALATSAPVPSRLLNEMMVVLGRSGQAEASVVKEARWADTRLREQLTSKLGQMFLESRDVEPGPMAVEGQKILVASSFLPKLRWPLVMAVPEKSAGMSASALLKTALWACGLGIVLSLGVSWFVASHLIRPLRRLQEAFREFSQGNWNVQVPVTSGDEIAELTDGFNQGVVFVTTQHRKLKRLQTLVHQTQDAVVLCSSKGSLVYANPSAYAFFGFQRREDTVLARLHDRVCAVDRERFDQTVWPSMLEGPWEGEIHFCRQDGKVQLGWLRGGSVSDEAGNAPFVYAIIRDISDRKAAEEALRNAEEYYRTVFRTSPDAIVVTNPSEVIVDVNEPGFPNVFGYERHEILGRPIGDLLAEEIDGTASLLSALKGSGRITVKWRRKDGSVFLGEATQGALKDAKDVWRGSVRVIRDVSEREALLERLEQTNQELKSLDELKDKFLAGVSHDLRTPLIPVRAFLEKLLQGKWGPLTARQEEFLRYCLIGVSREMILVEELLDYTRLKSGSLTLRKENVDLQDVLRASLFLLRILAETNRLTVAVDLPLDPVPIVGDYNKLLRIFHNLFSNAVKYNRPGGHVTVRGAWESPRRFRVAVEDSGIGIPQEDLRRIFDDFYRVGMSGTPVRGSGIGLAVVRELVHLHGAELDVQSTVGVGSVFSITFPVMEDSEIDVALSVD